MTQREDRFFLARLRRNAAWILAADMFLRIVLLRFLERPVTYPAAFLLRIALLRLLERRVTLRSVVNMGEGWLVNE